MTTLELNPREELLLRRALWDWARNQEEKALHEAGKKRPNSIKVDSHTLLCNEAMALMDKIGGAP